MKRTALALLLGLSAFAVQAQSPAAPVEATGPAAETKVITGDNIAKAAHDNGCIRETGTRLKRRDAKGCTGAPGESYSRADIDRTGAVDTADALRRLSPRVTVGRGN